MILSENIAVSGGKPSFCGTAMFHLIPKSFYCFFAKIVLFLKSNMIKLAPAGSL